MPKSRWLEHNSGRMEHSGCVCLHCIKSFLVFYFHFHIPKSRWAEHNSGRMEHSGCAKSGGCLLHIAPTWPACNLLHTTAYLKTLQHTKSYFNMLQHTVAYCNTIDVLQDTAAYLSIPQLLHTSTCCSKFKHIAAQSSTL